MASQLFNPPVGAAVNWGHPINTGMIGCWLMNEGGGQSIRNIAGRGQTNGTAVLNPTWTAGRLGRALNFNGSTQYVSNTIAVGLTNSFTFSVWVNVSVFPGAGTIMTSETASNFWATLQASSASGNTYVFSLFDGTNNPLLSTAALATGVWVHLAGVRDRNTTKIYLYVNGVQVGNATDTTTTPTYSAFTIGQQTTISRPFNGSITGVRLYSRALLYQEIRQLYAQPFAGINVVPRGPYAGVTTTTSVFFRRTLSPLGTRVGSRQAA